ncbi:MAG: penicillin-binding protein activator [Myxococcota bacterium]|nr:penicillin-binding protein activator [Myxococcota bacterium]
MMIRTIALLCALTACLPKASDAGTPDLVRRAQVVAVGDRMAAIRLLEDEIKSGRNDPSVHPWALLHAGEQRRLSGDSAAARTWFETLASKYPTHALKDPARLGMALVDAEQSLSGNTLATLQLMADKLVPTTMNADRYRILARIGADEGSPMPKVRALAERAFDYGAHDPSVLARVQESVGDLLASTRSEVVAEPTGTPEEIAVKRARSELASGRFDEAKVTATDAMETWPASIYTDELAYIVQRADAKNPTVAGKVGVLLPKTGDYAPAAAQLEQVIQLANAEAGSPIDLVFGDTAGTEEGTASEIERLVMKEGCVAILGPLLKTNGDEAAKRAQALQTPLVTLTQGGDPTAAGDFAFRGFMTLEHQVRALLAHSTENEGHQRYAVLHPDNGYGEAARDLFTAEVTRRGGEVTDVVSYATDTTDFREAAQELGQKHLEERKAELWEMKREAKRREEDPDKVMLPPVVDFDAIFIPDNHRRLVLVTSALAYEEFPVGTFRKHVDEEPIQLLGLNAWNNPAVVQTGGRYVQDSIFVDAFWDQDDDAVVQAFIEVFEASVERKPRVIDALAWDATRLLTAAVLEGGDDRAAIQAAMGAVEIDDPVAGGQSFNADREVDRRFHVLTITRSGIERWTPPPPDEPAPVD